MNKIIQYDDNLSKSNGALISPDGEIYYLNTSHEMYARKFCNGEEYEKLRYIKNCSSDLLFDEFKEQYSFDGDRLDIDEYCQSKLSSNDLKLYKLWLKKFGKLYREASALDFMVMFLSYDKVESIKKFSITTVSRIPHVRFFNYYLMDWEIMQLPRIIYNEEKSSFEYLDNRLIDLFHSSSTDLEALEEIDEIKSKVKTKNISYFFKEQKI